MKQKILVITTRPLETNVSSSIRKISTIQSLVESGAEVTILQTDAPKNSPQYNNKVDIGNAKRISIKPGKLYNIGVSKNSDNANKKRGFIKLKQVARRLYFKTKLYDPLKGCLKYLDTLNDKLEKKYNIIISISDPKSSHLLAINLLKKNIIDCEQYIQIWGDPMYLDITNKTIIPRSFIKREERRLLKNTDKIFYVSPLTMAEEKKLFPEFAYKMDILFPSYQEKTIYEQSQNIKKIGYFGDYNTNVRDILPLYKAINNSNYQLVIYGNSDMHLKSTKNVEVNRRVSFQEIKKIESEVDILVHLSNKYGNQIPGKLYQYMGTNKPILFILDGSTSSLKEFFGPYNRFIFCENSPNDILEKLFKYDKKEINIECAPVEEFHYKYMSNKILN